MPNFSINVELGNLLPEGSPLNADIFPTLSFAVQRIAEEAHQQWVAYASGAPMPNGKTIASRSGEYARSIQLNQTGDFSAEVYSELAYAQAIEEGSPERDLKTILQSSLKVRLTLDGRRYLIIPFRFDHPNSVMGNGMPESVQSWWSDKKASSITGTFQRPSGTGALNIKTRSLITVPGRKYSWGTRLGAGDLEGMGITGPRAKQMEGMVMFRKPNSGSGGAAHTKYLTFRTMVEGSKGWVAKAVEGKFPARQVADQLRPVAEEAFAKAVAEDVARAIGGQT